ncbi:MAG: hypothetical protein IJD57_00280 [Candidatus Gastranaerophilales bacterium]|nr:hypothetical protein [Candidatus Gastranaerophilales bacterium]
MFKELKAEKNYLDCCNLIQKAMLKRRKLAMAAIFNLCELRQKIRLVK